MKVFLFLKFGGNSNAWSSSIGQLDEHRIVWNTVLHDWILSFVNSLFLRNFFPLTCILDLKNMSCSLWKRLYEDLITWLHGSNPIFLENNIILCAKLAPIARIFESKLLGQSYSIANHKKQNYNSLFEYIKMEIFPTVCNKCKRLDNKVQLSPLQWELQFPYYMFRRDHD